MQVLPELNDDIVGGDGVVDLLPAAVDGVDHLGRALHDAAPQVVEDLPHVVDDVACNEVVVVVAVLQLGIIAVESDHCCAPTAKHDCRKKCSLDQGRAPLLIKDETSPPRAFPVGKTEKVDYRGEIQRTARGAYPTSVMHKSGLHWWR